jgi:tripartite-type tricarboxylate transporter receptor subunit TctC
MNDKLRKAWLGLFATSMGALTQVGMAADVYPSNPVKLVVPFAAGGGTDSVARVIAQVLGGRILQPVVVENKPGAGGSIGTIAAVQSPADGHTLLLGSNGTMVLNPLLYPQLKYQVDRDLVPVAGIASVPYLIAANPKLGATDIKSLLNLAMHQKLTFASPGNGTTNHLVGVLLESMSKTDMTHVPYRGAALAMNDVISGNVNFLSGDLGTLVPMVNAGKLRALAVTGPQRVVALPDVPTVSESGLPGFEATGWFGIFAPKGTPAAIVERLSSEIEQVLKEPRLIQRLHDLGGSPLALNADQLKRFIALETTKWRRVILQNKVTADTLQ